MLWIAVALWTAALPPCVTEDSRNCYWNARTMGNGGGKSFVDLGGHLIPFNPTR